MRVCKKCEGKQISIHAPRVGSDADALREQYAERIISIHAPRVGSDFIQESVSLRNFSISIHAPRVGSDLDTQTITASDVYFNPRSPCGERPVKSSYCPRCYAFQSTLPVWGATEDPQYLAAIRKISIHAPRVGSDNVFARFLARSEVFQSTLPVWGATQIRIVLCLSIQFQSTLPVWGATNASMQKMRR